MKNKRLMVDGFSVGGREVGVTEEDAEKKVGGRSTEERLQEEDVSVPTKDGVDVSSQNSSSSSLRFLNLSRLEVADR